MSTDGVNKRLARARIIVVEDSFPVASSLKSLLGSVGCEVVGMAGNVEAALAMVGATTFDVALLDINLRGEHVAGVADAVRERGKPVIFLTGYGDEDVLPSHLRALPRLEKPVDPTELFATIARVLPPAK